MNITVLTVVLMVASVIATWYLTKALGMKKRVLVTSVHILTLSGLMLANIYQSWVWFYNMHQAEQFVSRIASDKNWLGSNPEARDEIITLVFKRAQYLGEPAANVQLAIKKAEQLEREGSSRPQTNKVDSTQQP